MVSTGLCTPMMNKRVPVDRDVLLKIYAYMKSAHRVVDDFDDYADGLPTSYCPIFDKFEIDEVRKALRRKEV